MDKRNSFPLVVSVLLASVILGGCQTNPVTGDKQVGLVSTEQEIAIGKREYLTSRQSQGGDYVADPSLTRYVNQVGQRVARVSDRKLPYEFKVVNDSTPNAWALPGGKIAVNRGLLTELGSEAELAAVLSHEVVHAAARHSAQGIERGALLQGALIATSILVGGGSYSQLANQTASLGATMINQSYGRDAEREADQYSIKYLAKVGYDPNAAVELQKTFLRLKKQGDTDWAGGLFSSHPPSQERVDNNINNVQKYAAGKQGRRGVAEYRKATARLKRTKPAYEAYDEGVKLLSKGDYDGAINMAEKAMRIEPREALFNSLKGDAQIKKRKYPDALKSYDSAVAKDTGYFKNYLMRGLLREELGNEKGARTDLEKSMNLYPTTVAKSHLARLSAR